MAAKVLEPLPLCSLLLKLLVCAAVTPASTDPPHGREDPNLHLLVLSTE